MALINDLINRLTFDYNVKRDLKELASIKRLGDDEKMEGLIYKYRHHPDITEKQIFIIAEHKNINTRALSYSYVIEQLLKTDYAQINNVSENVIETSFPDIKPLHLLIAKVNKVELKKNWNDVYYAIFKIKYENPEIIGNRDGLGVERQGVDLEKWEAELKEIDKSLEKYDFFINLANKKLNNITPDDNVMFTKIRTELEKAGVNILYIESDDLERLAKSERTQKLIPISFTINGTEIKTDVYLSLQEKKDGSLSLMIHPIVDDQEMLRSISKSGNGVFTLYSSFSNEEKAINFIKRNHLMESFATVNKLYFEASFKHHYINNYMDDGVDRFKISEQARKDYAEIKEQLALHDQAFRLKCSSYNIVKGVELEPAQIKELKQGKTIEVGDLIDDKGKKYAGFIHLNLTDTQIKEIEAFPSRAINISKMAVITPKHDHKIQIDHNNHGMKTEEIFFSAILNTKQTESKSLSGPAIKAEASERKVSKMNHNKHQLNNNKNKKGQRL